jgi:hypothetical protein
VRTLRTLALLDLESHPPPAAIDRVTILIDPTPGRVLQHTLFARAHPTPEQLSTLLARLGALMGQDRIGAPALVDSYRPGAFVMTPFATDHPERERHSLLRVGPHPSPEAESLRSRPRDSEAGPARSVGAESLRSRPRDSEALPARSVGALQPYPEAESLRSRPRDSEALPARGGGAPREVRNVSGVDSINPNADMRVPQALRRCRHPVPARVAVVDGEPVRVTTDRRGFAGGQVLTRAGPWRTSGEWWAGGEPLQPFLPSWNRDEWDVALSDGAVYRIFRDRETDGWFIDAIAD